MKLVLYIKRKSDNHVILKKERKCSFENALVEKSEGSTNLK